MHELRRSGSCKEMTSLISDYYWKLIIIKFLCMTLGIIGNEGLDTTIIKFKYLFSLMNGNGSSIKKWNNDSENGKCKVWKYFFGFKIRQPNNWVVIYASEYFISYCNLGVKTSDFPGNKKTKQQKIYCRHPKQLFLPELKWLLFYCHTINRGSSCYKT